MSETDENVPEAPEPWSVYEHEAGIVWKVDPPTQEQANHEAELANEGLDYLGHEAMPTAMANRLSNAYNHGKSADHRLQKPSTK